MVAYQYFLTCKEFLALIFCFERVNELLYWNLKVTMGFVAYQRLGVFAKQKQ